jgi:hypothetical protein
MRQTLKQPCWFSLSSASQSGIPILENPLKLIARTQEIINLLLDLFEFVFRNGSNPVARNISTITHSQDGRQLSEREAHLQRTLDQSNAVKGVCRVISITAVGAGAVSAELPVVRSAAECRCLSQQDVTVHPIARVFTFGYEHKPRNRFQSQAYSKVGRYLANQDQTWRE